MKKSIAIMIALCLLAAGLLGISYWFGIQAEKTYYSLLEQASRLRGVKFTTESYERGVFNSRVITKVELQYPTRLDGVLRQFTLEYDIRHGPFPFKKIIGGKWYVKPAQAMIKTSITFDSDTQEHLNKIFPGFHKVIDSIEYYLIFHLKGNGETHVFIPAFSQKIVKDNMEFVVGCDSIASDMLFTADLKGLKGSFKIPELGIVGTKFNFKMEGIEYFYDVYEEISRLFLGKTSFDVARLKFTFKVNEKDQITSVDDFGIKTFSEKSGHSINYSVTTQIDKVFVKDDRYGPFVFDWEIRGFDAVTLSKFQNTIQELQIQNPQLAPEEMNKMIYTELLKILPQLMKDSPEIEIKNLSIEIPEGSIQGNAKIIFDGSKIAAIDKPEIFPDAISIQANASITNLLLEKFLDSVNKERVIAITKAKGEIDLGDEKLKLAVRDMTAKKIKSLIKENVLMPKDDNYTLSVTYQSGELILNGVPIPIQKLMKSEDEKQPLEIFFYKDWYALPITKGKGMFNPVFLGFQYTSRSKESDARQSATFPCLLSFKFDLVPDNYSARHPAFIFRKSSDVLEIKGEDKESITSYIHSWSATHSISGELIQWNEGYSGTMVVHDDKGEEILRVTFDEPMPYFELMGKMVKSWMEFRNQPISEGLLKELCRPMTTDMETVRWYGETFDVEWRSQDEWDIYDKILKRDPGFGEVQYWYANQKRWATGKKQDIMVEKALLNHLVIPALTHYSDFRYLDEKLLENHKKVLAYTEEIYLENPNVTETRLMMYGESLSLEELDSLLPLAHKYTASYGLLSKLAQQYEKRFQFEKSIPLFLSALNSGYLWSAKTSWPYSKTAYQLWQLGYIEESIQCIQNGLTAENRGETAWLLYYLGLNYQELFQYNKAAYEFLPRYKKLHHPIGLFSAYISLYEGGRLDEVQKWENDPDLVFEFSYISPLYNARKSLASGDIDKTLSLLKGIQFQDKNFDEMERLEAEFIRADVALLANDNKQALQHAINAWFVAPRSRRVARLLEKTLKDNYQNLGMYAEAALFLFPRKTFWKDVLLRAEEQGAKHENIEDVLARYDVIKQKSNNIAPEMEAGFWMNQLPFSIEYLCMRMVQMKEKEYKKEALKLYTRYADAIRSLSNLQRAHTHNFFIQMLMHIPQGERAQWLSAFNPKRTKIRREEDYIDQAKFEGSRNNFDEAIRIYNLTIQMYPDSSRPYFLRALTKYKKEDYAGAISDYYRAIQRYSIDPCAYNNLAWTYITCKKREYADARRALALSLKAVELKPDDNHSGTLAWVYAENGEFKKAIELAEELYRRNPSNENKRRLKVLKKGKTYYEWQKKLED